MMVMTSVSGHLLNYEFVPQFKNWQNCNPVQLFDAPVVKSCPQDYQKIKVWSRKSELIIFRNHYS